MLAADYIYMVDKVSESKYTDYLGVSDLGNGGAARNAYEEQQQQLLDVQVSALTDAMTAQISEVIENSYFEYDSETDDYILVEPDVEMKDPDIDGKFNELIS